MLGFLNAKTIHFENILLVTTASATAAVLYIYIYQRTTAAYHKNSSIFLLFFHIYPYNIPLYPTSPNAVPLHYRLHTLIHSSFLYFQSTKLGVEIWCRFVGIWPTIYKNEWNSKCKYWILYFLIIAGWIKGIFIGQISKI